MNKFLPSGKFLLILASIIIALGIIFGTPTLLNYYKNKKVVTVSNNDLQVSVKEFMAVDTDQDGLLDWEETLWKTNPKNPDTDGDGATDGEEIKLNRDPLKANTALKNATPNDRIDEQIIAEGKRDQEEYNKLTDTEKFSRELFSEYVVAKNENDGRPLDNTTKMEILNKVVDKTNGTTVNKYITADIKNVADMSVVSIKNYGNRLGEILIQYSVEGTGDELVIIQQALDQEDETILKSLSPIIKNYKNMVTGFLTLSVPKDFINIHLQMVNNFYNVIISLESMQNFFTDPVRGVGSIQTYQDAFKNLFTNIEILRIKMLEKKVTFDGSEPGFVFINVLQQ